MRAAAAAAAVTEELGDADVIDAVEELAEARHDRVHLRRQVVLDVGLQRRVLADLVHRIGALRRRQVAAVLCARSKRHGRKRDQKTFCTFFR